jgi:hypothetical protein
MKKIRSRVHRNFTHRQFVENNFEFSFQSDFACQPDKNSFCNLPTSLDLQIRNRGHEAEACGPLKLRVVIDYWSLQIVELELYR